MARPLDMYPSMNTMTATAADLATVNTDALIEGNAAAMAVVTAEIQAQFPAALTAYVARLQAASTAWMTAQAPNVTPNTITVDTAFKGRRFVRIISIRASGDRSVICFVEIGTGLIYKPATFKAPVTNFTRGCVFNLGDAWRVKGTDQAAAILPSY